MTKREARKRLKTIRKSYLCPVCLIPKAFCDEHSNAEREYAMTALRDIAGRTRSLPKQKETPA